jgi:SAM-dependent methyltransferase
MKLHHVLSWLFQQSLGRLKYYTQFSPDIEIVGNSEQVIRAMLIKEKNRSVSKGRILKFLDVGARDGTKADMAAGFDYHAIDIRPRNSWVLAGDICNCPQVPDDSFDVVFSLDVFEHVQRPWDAARECIRITKPGGLLVHRTLFAYRYHPIPYDYWRFSSQGLEYLFTSAGDVTTVLKGYDIRSRRKDRRGYNLLSKPPIDWLGGFRENWKVLWIGRKEGS